MAKKNVRKGSKPRGKAASKKLIKKKAVAKKAPKSAKPAAAVAPAGEARRAVELLEWCHSMTARLCDGFDGDRLYYQSNPNENHVVWQIGHLATGYSWFASMLDGAPASLGESFDKAFGFGSKPVNDASAYPSLSDVKRVHDEQYARLLAAAKQLKDSDALVAVESSGGFAKNKIDLINKASWHEGWHQGQLSSLRRALGMPSVMG